jgi:enediyne biosynthesis thioesterase
MPPQRAFELRHRVGFEETNLVGNVYYVNHLRWQGRCRELFLADLAPGVLEELRGDLSLATLHCSCEYFAELFAFDEIVLRMRLQSMVQNRLILSFEYWRATGEEEELVARGSQEIACLRRNGDELAPCPIPEELRRALEPFRAEE